MNAPLELPRPITKPSDSLVGSALRALRKFVALRLRRAPHSRCLAELNDAAEAIATAKLAIEGEAADPKGER